MNRLLLVPLALGATSISAQTPGPRTLDRGSFTISVKGEVAGRETFAISNANGPNGVEVISSGTSSFGGRETTPQLRSDSAGGTTVYRIEIRGSGTVDRWAGTVSRGRVRAQMTSAKGPAEREYIVSDGAPILEDDIFHQYFFVVQRATGPTLPVVVPLRNKQLVLRVTVVGQEKLTVGTTSLDARHYSFAEPTGETREVWVDARHRVLKVAIPSRQLIALRDEPPSA